MDEGFLGGRSDADIKGDFSAVDPLRDEDVSGTRLRARDKAGHFLRRVKRRMLRLLVYFVPNPVMPASFDAVIVSTVHGVVA